MARTLTDDEVLDFVDRFMGAWRSRDPDALASFGADDVELRSPPHAPPKRGRGEVRDWMATMFRAVPDMRVEMVDQPFVSLGGRRVAIEWTLNGTFTGPFDPPGLAPTGQPIWDHGVDVLALVDGKVHRWLSAYDMMGVGTQMGGVPPEGSMAERIGMWMQRRTAARMRKAAATSQ